MYKLGQVGHAKIDRSGCYLLCLLDIAEAHSKKKIDREMVKLIYDLLVPKYMRKDCYLLSHEKILRVAFMAVGLPDIEIAYPYRLDDGKLIIPGDLVRDRCNYFIAGVPYPDDPDGKHFYRSNQDGKVLWNPGQTTGEVVTLRGYRIG